MTSEEFRRNPLLLRNQFEKTGTFEIPHIKKDEVSLDNISLIGYDKLNSGRPNQIVHFFLDDYKFEVLWNNPETRIERLSGFQAVLSPQFSIYSEMPVAIQIHNTFRSRWCGAYLQSKGIKVIPSVVWGEPDTFWFCFDGIIQNCGINDTVRFWDDETGLNQPRRKGVIQNMENALQGKAFLAMYHLLDSIYSRHPYHNLAVVLGDINPYIFKDRMPADPAAWQDFCEYYEEAKGTYSSEIEVGYYTSIRFLRVYEEEWDYPIPYAMEEFTLSTYGEYYHRQME